MTPDREIDALFAIHDAAHAGTGMTDQGDVATPHVVIARVEAAYPDAVVGVVEAHAVGAAQQQTGLADARLDALCQARVVGREQLRHDGRRPTAVVDRGFEGCFHVRVTDAEDHVPVRVGRRR